MNRALLIASLVLSYFVFAILLNSVGTVILQSIGSFGVDKSSAAVLEAFKDMPIAVISFLVASSLPRFGYRRAMIVGFAAVLLACVAMPMAPGFLTTKLMFLIVGAAFALIKISVYSTIGLLTETSSRHASVLNTIEGFFMVGVLSGYWIFAAFVDPDASSLEWLNVYWLLAALVATNIVVLLVVQFPQQISVQQETSLIEEFSAMLTLLWKPAVVVFVIAAFLYVLIEQGIGTWLPTFNNEVLHLPAAMSIQATSIFAGALAIGRLSAGLVLRRMSWFWLLSICVIAMAILIVLTLPLTRNLQPIADLSWGRAPAAAFLLPLIGLFMAPIYPAINSVILSSLPRHRHAAMTGLIVVFSALGGTTGSYVTGRLFEQFDGSTAFYTMLVPIAGIFVALLVLNRVASSPHSSSPS